MEGSSNLNRRNFLKGAGVMGFATMLSAYDTRLGHAQEGDDKGVENARKDFDFLLTQMNLMFGFSDLSNEEVASDIFKFQSAFNAYNKSERLSGEEGTFEKKFADVLSARERKDVRGEREAMKAILSNFELFQIGIGPSESVRSEGKSDEYSRVMDRLVAEAKKFGSIQP